MQPSIRHRGQAISVYDLLTVILADALPKADALRYYVPSDTADAHLVLARALTAAVRHIGVWRVRGGLKNFKTVWAYPVEHGGVRSRNEYVLATHSYSSKWRAVGAYSAQTEESLGKKLSYLLYGRGKIVEATDVVRLPEGTALLWAALRQRAANWCPAWFGAAAEGAGWSSAPDYGAGLPALALHVSQYRHPRLLRIVAHAAHPAAKGALILRRQWESANSFPRAAREMITHLSLWWTDDAAAASREINGGPPAPAVPINSVLQGDHA